VSDKKYRYINKESYSFMMEKNQKKLISNFLTIILIIEAI